MNKSFSKKIFSSVSFGFLERIFDLIFGVVITIIVFRVLQRSEYGILGYVTSYGVFINTINIAPENYLFKLGRDSEHNVFRKYHKSALLFNIAKGFVVLGLYSLIGFILSKHFASIVYLEVAFVNGVVFVFTQFTATSKIVLQIYFKQKMITVFSFISKLAKLIITSLLFIFPLIEIVLISELAFALLMALLTYVYLRKIPQFGEQIKISMKEIIKKVMASIKRFALWNHLSGVCTNIIYKIDPWILGFFVTMSAIGTYNISLKITNYTIVFFQVIQLNTGIALANSNDQVSDKRIVKKMLLLSLMMSVFMITCIFIFGNKILLLFMSKEAEDLDEALVYLIYITIGLSIFNISRPLSSYLIFRKNTKHFFMRVVFPSLCFSFITYFTMASLYGSRGVAINNVIAYIFWTSLVLKEYFRKENRLA